MKNIYICTHMHRFKSYVCFYAHTHIYIIIYICIFAPQMGKTLIGHWILRFYFSLNKHPHELFIDTANPRHHQHQGTVRNGVIDRFGKDVLAPAVALQAFCRILQPLGSGKTSECNCKTSCNAHATHAAPCWLPWWYTGWWFQPLWKILVSLDDYSQYMEKQKMFQTTNQYIIPNTGWLDWVIQALLGTFRKRPNFCQHSSKF